MADVSSERVDLGIWASWDRRVNVVGEGMSHMLGMLVEGAAQSGRVRIHVGVRPVNFEPMRQMLRGLPAREGADWIVHRIEDAQPGREGGAEGGDEPPPDHWPALSDRAVGTMLFVAGIAALPFLALRALLRPAVRFAWRNGLGLAMEARRDPVSAAPVIAMGLRRLPLPGVRRLADGLLAWANHRRAAMEQSSGFDGQQALMLPDWRVPSLDAGGIDGWLSLMPALVVPPGLPGRRAVLVPDTIWRDFTAGWNPAAFAPNAWPKTFFPYVRRNIEACDAILTFSEHVARNQVVEGYGVDPAKLRIVPHAPPDLRSALPYLPKDGRRNETSRRAAATTLRRHATQRGWSYLADFPFEHVDYIALSTQERPSKNLSTLIEALHVLVQQNGADLKLLMTTEVVEDPATPHFRIRGQIRRHGLGLDAVSVPRLPAAEHAAFYHGAALAVHPAFFEGGDAPFPFSEAVGVGTPCLMARGPHTEELLRHHPELQPFMFDPRDVEGLAALIARGLAERDSILAVQQAVQERMRARRWADVTEEYAAATTGIPLVPVRRLIPAREPAAASDPANAAASAG